MYNVTDGIFILIFFTVKSNQTFETENHQRVKLNAEKASVNVT